MSRLQWRGHADCRSSVFYSDAWHGLPCLCWWQITKMQRDTNYGGQKARLRRVQVGRNKLIRTGNQNTCSRELPKRPEHRAPRPMEPQHFFKNTRIYDHFGHSLKPCLRVQVTVSISPSSYLLIDIQALKVQSFEQWTCTEILCTSRKHDHK